MILTAANSGLSRYDQGAAFNVSETPSIVLATLRLLSSFRAIPLDPHCHGLSKEIRVAGKIVRDRFYCSGIEALQSKTCHRIMFQQNEASDIGRERVDTLMEMYSGC
jgi:hypothetical protein